MRDYAKQVKALREGAEWAEKLCAHETAKRQSDAADAIEELQKALDAVNDAHNDGYDVGYWAGRRDYEPKWISVDERQPSDDSLCLVCGPKGGMTVARPYMPAWNGIWKGDPKEIWWTKTGTGKTVPVTHWMPLPKKPEPPEEDQ